MNRRPKLIGITCAIALAVFQAGCAAPIPREAVPVGWALNVHQPGAWWTQPLIPRSVVVQRCPPPPGWASSPDLTKEAGLRPGIDVNYSSGVDDYHCLIGWSEPASEVEFPADEMASEAGLRRVCSSSGLRMDASWRFLGHNATERVGNLPSAEDVGVEMWKVTTAAFIDDYDTVVGCLVENLGDAGAGASVELSLGGDTASSPSGAVCPVLPRNMAREEDGTLLEYQLRGAGAVRDNSGRILTEATRLQIGVVGDSVTTSHPVVDGIAIVDAWVVPKVPVHFEWDSPPPVQGQVYGPDGSVLATCHS
ncbi:MAG: hypothetical protein ACOH1Y_11605 [Propionicimonas sp.]